MGLTHEHEIHKRRFGLNLGVGLTLGAFVVLLVVLTIVKVSNGNGAALQGFNHDYRPDLATGGN